MYLFTDNFGIKNKSYKKQVFCGAPWYSVVLCGALQWFCTFLWSSSMICGALYVIHCFVSALSAIFVPLLPVCEFYQMPSETLSELFPDHME